MTAPFLVVLLGLDLMLFGCAVVMCVHDDDTTAFWAWLWMTCLFWFGVFLGKLWR